MRLTLVFVTIVLLQACGEPDSPSADYLQRLSNVLKVKIPPVRQPPFPVFPDSKALNLTETKKSISIREFLGLRQCKLHLVIAERNSQIGKVSGSSQRLKNDLDILNTGPECLTKITEQSLRNKLSAYLEVKRKQLPGRLWHALLAGNEYKKFWQQQGHLSTYPGQLPIASTMDDLTLLTDFVDRILDGDYAASDLEFSELERAMGRLRYGDAGQLLSELRVLERNLAMANELINARLETKLCINTKPNIKARYLQNIVIKYFVANVQKQAVELKRRHQHLMPKIHRLETSLNRYATAPFNQWVTQRNSQLDGGLKATLMHAKQLQIIYRQCGLKTGEATRNN